jgi:dephospho-CoA kinase
VGRRIPVIGLIGGIGAGKSAAAAAFAHRGGAVIDADALGHRALARDDAKAWLVRRWGDRMLRPDGSPDRRAVAGIVFADPAERRALEAEVFPHIRRLAEAELEDAAGNPAVRFAALDAAVLLEAGWADACDRLVFVDAPRDVRVARVLARSGWTAADLDAREAAQLPAAQKRSRADAVLVNDGSPEALQRRVDGLLAGWGLLPAGSDVEDDHV